MPGYARLDMEQVDDAEATLVPDPWTGARA